MILNISKEYADFDRKSSPRHTFCNFSCIPKITLLMALVLFLLLSTFSSDDYKDSYVEKWKEISIVESNRSGIPAAIILGQAILESNYGQSELATEAKNHFGIKCKKEWLGGSFYKRDDDRNDNGDLIESCFRAYDLDIDSFIDHSHFLAHRWHYSDLFKYAKIDYRSWANGLQNSGYATDPSYAKKLIRIIETHELWRLDLTAH